jgi:hypothetical protein
VPDESGNYKIRNGGEAIPVVGMRLPRFARSDISLCHCEARECRSNLYPTGIATLRSQ